MTRSVRCGVQAAGGRLTELSWKVTVWLMRGSPSGRDGVPESPLSLSWAAVSASTAWAITQRCICGIRAG